jgi:uncharacterized protein with GYD domain
MPTYVPLINWTDQGIRVGRETVQRAARADELAHKHGARFERLCLNPRYYLKPAQEAMK